MTTPSTPSPDAAGPAPTDNRVYHCICEAADGKGHLPACVLSNTTATSAIPIVAASPEGSAGNLHSLIELALETCDLANEDIAIVRAAIPGLIDASRERDRLQELIDVQSESLLEVVADRNSAQAQFIDARSRVSELEAELGRYLNQLAKTQDARDRLRFSREQAIAAIEASPRYRPGDERESGMVSTQSGLWLHRSAVLAILRGAE